MISSSATGYHHQQQDIIISKRISLIIISTMINYSWLIQYTLLLILNPALPAVCHLEDISAFVNKYGDDKGSHRSTHSNEVAAFKNTLRRAYIPCTAHGGPPTTPCEIVAAAPTGPARRGRSCCVPTSYYTIHFFPSSVIIVGANVIIREENGIKLLTFAGWDYPWGRYRLYHLFLLQVHHQIYHLYWL